MKRKITTTVEVDGEIYIFRIQREEYKSNSIYCEGEICNELTITSSPNLPTKIKELIDVMYDVASHLL